MSMVRLALIGCGESALEYAVAAPRLPEIAFTAVVDPDLGRARDTARALGAITWCRTFDELLAQNADAFDAVLIHCTGRCPAAMVCEAARAGKHVLVESPLALSTHAADEAIAACRQADVRLMVGHSTRFQPSQQAVKQTLDEGKLGEPGLVRIHRWEPRGSAAWHKHVKNEASTLVPHLADDIDLACWLMGKLPMQIYAAGRRPSSTNAPNDYVQLHLGFPSSGMALIDYSMALAEGAGYFSLSLIGASGAAYFDDHHNTQLVFRGGDPDGLLTDQGQGHLIAQLREFAAAVTESREPAITGEEGSAAIQIAEAAAESLAAGRAVHRAGDRYELV